MPLRPCSRPLIRPSATFSPTKAWGRRRSIGELGLIWRVGIHDRTLALNSRSSILKSSRRSTIERLLPPRFLRGEKVPKADEGRFASHLRGFRLGRFLGRPLKFDALASLQPPPHPAFGHLLPHKSVGEKALDWRVGLDLEGWH